MKSSTNKQKGKVMSLFPTPVVVVNIGRSFTKDEADCITDIPMKSGKSNHQSKDRYLFDNYSETLKDIKKFCEQEHELYLKEIEGANTDLAGLRITQSWLNKTKPGESHHPHTHLNSYLSGVLYITCLPNDSIILENRMQGMFNNIIFPIKKRTAWNSVGVTIMITEGDLILFPSWIPHSVNRNETKNRERISLAFNTFPIGEIGNYDNVTHLKL